MARIRSIVDLPEGPVRVRREDIEGIEKIDSQRRLDADLEFCLGVIDVEILVSGLLAINSRIITTEIVRGHQDVVRFVRHQCERLEHVLPVLAQTLRDHGIRLGLGDIFTRMQLLLALQAQLADGHRVVDLLHPVNHALGQIVGLTRPGHQQASSQNGAQRQTARLMPTASPSGLPDLHHLISPMGLCQIWSDLTQEDDYLANFSKLAIAFSCGLSRQYSTNSFDTLARSAATKVVAPFLPNL